MSRADTVNVKAERFSIDELDCFIRSMFSKLKLLIWQKGKVRNR